MIKAVILDLDDTLFLTEAVCFEMENEVLINIGRKPMSRQIHKDTWGQALLEAIRTRSPGVDVEAYRKAFEPVITAYVKDGKLDSMPQENLHALDTLLENGKELYIVTSRDNTELRHLLEPDHFLASRIKMFYHKENMKYRKPDPRAFDELFAHTGYRPEECVYVGDSLTDAEAANGANIPFIASLESGLRSQEDFGAYKVANFVNTFPQIVEAVQKLEH